MDVLEIGAAFGFKSVISLQIGEVSCQNSSLIAIFVSMVDFSNLGGVYADVAPEELDVV
jgi:hypothetical protein